MNPNEASANKTYNITANTTTIIPVPERGKFVLLGIVINTKGGSSNIAKIYDSNEELGADSQRLKATIDTTSSIGRLDYGFPCFKGIYIVTSAGTPADITVIYADTP